MYLILKTSNEEINRTGSVFEAVRGHWSLDPDHAKNCSHAIAVVDKIIEGVFTIDKWYPSTTLDYRFVFAGEVDEKLTKKLIGKKLNPELTLKAAQNPVRYAQEDELLEV